jgi:hypothetical protein
MLAITKKTPARMYVIGTATFVPSLNVYENASVFQ